VSKPTAPGTFSLKFRIVSIVAAVLVVAVAALLFAAPAAHRPHASLAAAPALSSQAMNPAVPARTDASHAQGTYAALPLAFEANQGQADSQVKYLARGNGYKLFLTSSQAVMTVSDRRKISEVKEMMMNKRRGLSASKAFWKKRAQHRAAQTTAVLRMNLLGPQSEAKSQPELIAGDLQPGKVNYFVGRDQSKWHSNIPLYGRVNYRGVFPGVDLAFHGLSKQLEFDYLVSPGADPTPVALSIEGAQSIHADDSGNLILATSAGPVQLHKPVAYQTKNGAREAVDARFILKATNEIAFALGPYDHNRELVIDPVVTYSTYFGGNGEDYAAAVSVDSSGNAYVAGATDSDTIPGPNGTTVAPNNNGAGAGTAFDTFVTKISPAGACLFTTFFGGSSDDFPAAIAVDSAGIYVAGTTDSDDFPATVGQQAYSFGGPNGDGEAYAVTLALDGSALTWGTYVEGSDETTGFGLAVDSGHNLYVVGYTFASDLGGGVVHPLPNGGAINRGSASGDEDGYIVKLSSDGTTYLLVSYLGGDGPDLASAVALDTNGNIYVAGETQSTNFPVTAGVVQSQCGTNGTCNGGDDAFAVAIKANLSNYIYATYYGGSGGDDALAVAADGSGNAFLLGDTNSTDFPTSGTPFQGSLAGAQNAFLVELNSTGTAATESTYFGGNGTEYGIAITLDGSDNVYITGQTNSTATPPGAFPLTVNAGQSTLSGPTDAFVSVLSLSQSKLLYSTYLGGGGDEDQSGFAGIGIDGSRNVYVTGDTDSGNGSTAKFPTTAGAIDSSYAAGTCTTSGNSTVPCPTGFVAAYTDPTAPDFGISATAPSAVSPGTSGTSTVTLTAVNGYNLAVNLTCAVTGGGSPAPACSASSFATNPQTPSSSGATSALTITTTGSSAALNRPAKIFYAMWLPIVGLSLVGMRFSTTGSRRKKLLGFLLLGAVMALLFFLPACSSGSSGGGGGGGCTGCTPAGAYTVTVTGTDSNNLTHSTAVTLNVN
jgi:hypothetical protein